MFSFIEQKEKKKQVLCLSVCDLVVLCYLLLFFYVFKPPLEAKFHKNGNIISINRLHNIKTFVLSKI